MNTHAKFLLVLQALFLGRVLGQVLVVLIEPTWLPALGHWYSGLLPYHILLPAQIMLLMLMSLVSYDACRRDGYWHVSKASTRKTLRVIAIVYFAVMILRYVLTMVFVPELRWLGHTIPIFFHFVLASYLLVLSMLAAQRASASRPATT